MASISKRGTTWTVRVRRRGYHTQVKTFRTNGLAERWALDVEAKMDAAAFVPSAREAERMTLDAALERYARDVTARKRSSRPEALRIEAITGHKTWAMLKRYTHPRAADLARKLAGKGTARTRRAVGPGSDREETPTGEKRRPRL